MRLNIPKMFGISVSVIGVCAGIYYGYQQHQIEQQNFVAQQIVCLRQDELLYQFDNDRDTRARIVADMVKIGGTIPWNIPQDILDNIGKWHYENATKD